MPVPYTFGTATAAIPLSQLDSNFATAITIGNTAVYLGNTTTSLGNVTLTNVTITSGTSNITTNVATVTGTLPEANGGTGTTTGYYGFKSRIINGGMVIDQRNAGASVNTSSPNAAIYTLDRWYYAVTQASKFTVQQNAGNLTGTNLPSGFANYFGVTSSSAYSILSTDSFGIRQAIEGFNTSDFNWGTSNAQAVTLSFWVRSSLTGTFGGSIFNSAVNRFYVFSYTISSANTWEQKSVTIAGDTSGTWVGATNGTGLYLHFSVGSGSNFTSTAGSWGSTLYLAPTGQVNVTGTNGATFYITGVQLEKGSTATSFDYRPYGTELALCQRYLPCMNGNTGERIQSIAVNTTQVYSVFNFGVEPRIPPTGITVTTVGNFSLFNYRTGAGSGAITGIVYATAGKLTGTVLITTSSVAGNDTCHLYPAASGQILFTGCEL